MVGDGCERDATLDGRLCERSVGAAREPPTRSRRPLGGTSHRRRASRPRRRPAVIRRPAARCSPVARAATNTRSMPLVSSSWRAARTPVSPRPTTRTESPEVGSLELPPTAARLRHLALSPHPDDDTHGRRDRGDEQAALVGLHQTRESTDPLRKRPGSDRGSARTRVAPGRAASAVRRPAPRSRRTGGSTRRRSRNARRPTSTASRGSLWSESTGSRTCRRTARPGGARGPRHANTSIGRTR